jgi:proline iminopeptidase
VRELYPEIEPYESGMLDVGNGNQMYWEVCGNPAGRPAVVLHGGPGVGCTPRHRRFLDPRRYRIVLLDQRGCGRSTPNAGTPDSDLTHNTTWHLIADMERLREHLGIQRWLVFGGSWGTTLALAYAESHPNQVTEMVLFGITTARRRERDWYWGGGAGFLFPEAWSRFLDPVPAERRDHEIVEAFHDLLHDPDPAVRRRATAAWDGWDNTTMMHQPPAEPVGPADESRAYTAARICVHYLRHAAWLEEGSLLRDAGKLANIPGILVQGRYDVQTPATTAWALSRSWLAAELVIVEDAGHSALDPGMQRELLRATQSFAQTPIEDHR